MKKLQFLLMTLLIAVSVSVSATKNAPDGSHISISGTEITVGDLVYNGSEVIAIVYLYDPATKIGKMISTKDAKKAWGGYQVEFTDLPYLGKPVSDMNGMQNTGKIVSKFGATNPDFKNNYTPNSNYAAYWCNELPAGDFAWHLPSVGEWQEIFTQKSKITNALNAAKINFANGCWTSNHAGDQAAWLFYFENALKVPALKYTEKNVYAVRNFNENELTTGTPPEGCTPIKHDAKTLGWTAEDSRILGTHETGGEGNPNNVFDGKNDGTDRWVKYTMKDGDWFMVDMKESTYINKIVIDHSLNAFGDRLLDYELYLSDDKNNMGSPVTTGSFGSATNPPGLLEISFPGQAVRYFKIVKTGNEHDCCYWVIPEMYVYGEECPCTPVPLTATITAGAEAISQGATTTITLASSLNGVTYTLYRDDVLVPSSTKVGNGGNLVWSNIGEAGKYTVKAIGDGDVYCNNMVTMNKNITITIIGSCTSVQYDPKTLGWTASSATTHASGSADVTNPAGGYSYLDPNNVFDYTGQYGNPVGSPSKWTDLERILANTPGNYFMVDMKQILPITKIVMDYTAGVDVDDYVRTYAIDISNDNISWTSDYKTGTFSNQGDDKVLREIVLPEGTMAKYFRIRPIVRGTGYWGIVNMYVYKEECPCTPVPTAATITAAESVISQGATTTITLASSLNNSVTYTLYLDGVTTGSSKNGNGNALAWTVGDEGRYTIKAIGDGATYCNTEVELNDDAIVTVSPNVGISDITGEKTVVGIFDTIGRELNNEPLSGVYIVKYSDGTTKKFVK